LCQNKKEMNITFLKIAETMRIGLYQRNQTVEPAGGWFWYDSRFATGSADWPLANDTDVSGIWWNSGSPDVS
jgi:hypothetical protein